MDKEKAYKMTARGKNPVAIGIVLAIITFVLVAPIFSDGNAMAPTIKDSEVIIIQKKTFSVKRGMPEEGLVVALIKDFHDGKTKGEYVFARVMGNEGDEVQVATDGDKISASIDPKEIRGIARVRLWPLNRIGKIR